MGSPLPWVRQLIRRKNACRLRSAAACLGQLSAFDAANMSFFMLKYDLEQAMISNKSHTALSRSTAVPVRLNQ
jgi:hypothetical protein